MTSVPPLLVTAGLGAAAQEIFDTLRGQHFPAGRNVVAAHLTLFHRLPGGAEPTILADLIDVAATSTPIDAVVSGLRSLGRGVAYDIASPELVALRATLAQRWWPDLGGQDRAWRRPHVTIQNKATPEAAAALLAELGASFTPWPVCVERLVLWRYLGGPWEHVADVPLGERPA